MGIASILVAQCRSWVIHDRCGRSHASMSVRYCRKADKRADVSGRPLCARTGLMQCNLTSTGPSAVPPGQACKI
jgi:hypothetical protein